MRFAKLWKKTFSGGYTTRGSMELAAILFWVAVFVFWPAH